MRQAMTSTLERLEVQALDLPDDSRAELAERLLASLVPAPDPAVEEAWLEEAERRHQELVGGSAEAIPAEEVFTRLRARRTADRS